MDLSAHPCFDDTARAKYARVHLPVAPTCNVQCNYCDRRFDCANESRPGVSSVLLKPEQAAAYVDEVVAKNTTIRVVGIAGPGDPLAAASVSLSTLRLVRERHPDMLLCVATNGLSLAKHADALADLQISHATVTVSAVDPEIGGRIYAWVRDGADLLRGREAGERMWQAQAEGIRALVRRGVMVKINAILIPGVNDDHLVEVARQVASLGASRFNCLPLHPVPSTAFGHLPEPDKLMVHGVRALCGKHLQQMEHCARCRADAIGRIGQANSTEQLLTLQRHAKVESVAAPASATTAAPASDATTAGPTTAGQSAAAAAARRRYVAVASHEGLLVNRHLGEADRFLIFGQGTHGFEMIEAREAPEGGAGSTRWLDLANVLADCKAIMVSSAGANPKLVLAARGIETVETEGLIEDALDAYFAGRSLPKARIEAFRCGSGKGAECGGDGLGCG